MRKSARLGVVLCLLSAGCGGGKNPLTGSGTITYRVSGSATRADVTFEASSGVAQQSNVTLPWSTNRPAKTGDFLYISAQNRESSGCVMVQILGGGDVLEVNQSCGGFVIATASRTY